MSGESYLTLDELGEIIHREVNERFQDRPIPSESVSENFVHQIVLTIVEDLESEGKIPFVPEFKILNKTSMEERFADNIPNFSKHINLVGLDKERPADEFGVMNVAFDGDDAEQLQRQAEEHDSPTADDAGDVEPEQPEASSDSEEPDPRDDEKKEDDGGVDIPDYLTVIEGGKSKS